MSRLDGSGCLDHRHYPRRPILTLPLERRAVDEPVMILELLRVAGLVERNEQEDVTRPLDGADIQMAVENSRPNSAGISSRE